MAQIDHWTPEELIVWGTNTWESLDNSERTRPKMLARARAKIRDGVLIVHPEDLRRLHRLDHEFQVLAH